MRRSFLYNKECEYEEIYRIYHHEMSPFHGDNSAADDKLGNTCSGES